MMRSLSEWNEWWTRGEVDPDLLGKERSLSRDCDDLLSFGEIKTVLGIRRCGKSTLLYHFIDHLLKERSVDPKQILLINFEDSVFSKEPLERIFDQYQSEINSEKKPYLFLDEVHRCPQWAMFLRKLYDLKKIEQVFITDSSSKFIPSEYAKTITGREITITVFPLTFSEMLDWKGIEHDGPLPREQINRIRGCVKEYLRWGGLPAVMSQGSDSRKKILLTNYIGDIVHKDIVERYNVDFKKISMLVDHLLANTGSLFSPRRFSRTHGLSLDSINTYMGYLEEVFLFHPVAKYDRSFKKQQINPKKVYVADTGFFGNTGFNLSENKGRLYENAVFQRLQTTGRELFYWKGDRECDFIVKEGTKVVCAIQVCSDLNTENVEREIEGLVEAMRALGLKEGIIVTGEDEKEDVMDGMKVRFVPLWKWMLE